jgi:hypothetical protein
MHGDGFSFESWAVKHWRPYMAWSWIIVCIFDLVIAPIAWTGLQAYMGMPLTQGVPISFQGGAFYHMAMGAVVGITAWSRGQEKIKYMDATLTTEEEK